MAGLNTDLETGFQKYDSFQDRVQLDKRDDYKLGGRFGNNGLAEFLET